MKNFVILGLCFSFLVTFSTPNVYAPPSVNPDWQNYPYCPGGCPMDYLKQEWSRYYDLKGSEWMESKKLELLSAMNNGTLRSWVDGDLTKANQNVFTYYYTQGEIPDFDGKYFAQIPSCDEYYFLENEDTCFLEKEPPCPVPTFNQDGRCVVKKGSLCMVDEKFRNVECPKTTEIICGEGTELVDGVCQVIKTDTSRDCLIATASYGSELAPQVQMLREVRDNTLLSTYSGSLFMNSFNSIYYSFSPTIAQWENENPLFKETVKLFITPMISALSIMTLAEENSEIQVVLYGMTTLGLIIGMYLVAPTTIIIKIKKRK